MQENVELLRKKIEELETENALLKELKNGLWNSNQQLSNEQTVAETITFEELFVLEDIQHLQDMFANAVGVASIITHTDGSPITKPSNFCRLCQNIIRGTEKGLVNCFHSDAVIGRHRREGPIVQKCLSGGLWDAGAGITVGGRHIANWLMGQVRDEAQSEDTIIAYAREIGVDESLMLEAFHEVPAMSLDTFNKVAGLLFTLAKQLSRSAYENVLQARFISLREEADKKLIRSEEKYRALVESSSDLVWEVDVSGVYTYVSPQITEILGYQPEEVIGKSVFELMSSQEAERIKGLFEQTVAAQLPIVSLENKNMHRNGSTVVLETSGVPILDQNNVLTGYRGVDRDITERLETQEILRSREATLTSIFVSAPVGIGMVIERTFSWVNQRFCEITGYSAGELIHKVSRILYPDREEFERVGQTLYHQISQKGSGSIETNWVRKNGEIIDVLLNSTPLDQWDWKKGMTITALDITERKKAIRLLQESERTYRQIFNASNDVIFIHDIETGKIIDVNFQLKSLYGYDYEESLCLDIEKLSAGVPPYAGTDAKVWLEKTMQEGPQVFEWMAKDKDGRVFWVEVSLKQASISGVDRILAVVRDIRERKAAEKKLLDYKIHLENMVERRTAEIQAKNKELETFTYSVSHDLKAPLRGIDGYSRLLEEEYAKNLDEEGLVFLNNIRQSAAQMNQLIEDLLAYSRMERRDIQSVSVDLPALIDNLVSLRSHDFEQHKIQFSVDLPFVNVTCDIETLRQVLSNYLDNAVKFCRQDQQAVIEVGGRDNPDSWTLWVRDNGIGFNQKYETRIFEIFQRLHRTEDFPGTGVGLAIVRKAVERVGGRVWAESAPDKGATFYFEIPKSADILNR